MSSLNVVNEVYQYLPLIKRPWLMVKVGHAVMSEMATYMVHAKGEREIQFIEPLLGARSFTQVTGFTLTLTLYGFVPVLKRRIKKLKNGYSPRFHGQQRQSHNSHLVWPDTRASSLLHIICCLHRPDWLPMGI